MAVDAAGNTYVVGVLYGTMTLDNGLQLVASATNDADGFVVKYTPTGAVAWAHRLGAAPGYDTANGVALDAAGNVYVTGQFSGQVSVGSFLLNAFPGSGAYLVKYDAQGVAQWARQSTTQSVGQTAIGHDVELDAAGNIYTTGTISWGGLLWPRAAYPRPGSLLYALCGQVRCGRHGAMGASRGLDDC
jgi:outer membrane protein assembly factor BamB